MKRKILSIFLSLAVALTMMPVSVLANDTGLNESAAKEKSSVETNVPIPTEEAVEKEAGSADGDEEISENPNGSENTEDVNVENNEQEMGALKIAQVEGVGVAQIGDKTYPTLADAVAEVPTDGKEVTITMIDDATIMGNAGVTVNTGQNIVLDLNGKTVKNAVNENKASQVINNKGTLTIKDSAGNGCLTNAIKAGTAPGEWWSTPQHNYATNVITNAGTLTVKGGNIYETAEGSICYAIDNNSSGANAVLNIEGGYIHKDSGTAIRAFANSTVKETNYE